jgi:hypothetical protein
MQASGYGKKLAIKTAEAARLASPMYTADLDPVVMPLRRIPSDAASKPKPQA